MIDTIYLCPSIDECHWEGRQEDILPHFEKCHNEFLLSANHFNLELNHDVSTNYLMHLNGDTFLIQFRYSQLEDTAVIRLRLLGTLKKAQNLSYYIEIDSGNFAFSTKNHTDGYSLITRKDGAVLVDISGIRTICGRKTLKNVVCFVNIEGKTNTYVSKSIKRIFHDGKVLDSKIRETFQRNSSFRSSIRRKSVESFEFELNRRKSLVFNDTIGGILQEIIDKAVDESESKHLDIDSPALTDPFSASFFQDFFNDKDFAFQNNFLDFESTSSTFLEINEFSAVSVKTELESIQEHESEHMIKITEVNSEIGAENEYNLSHTDSEVVLRQKPSKLTPNRLSRAETEYYEKIQLMRCENCFMIMIPPIFVCLNGHSVCLTCKPSNCSCKSEVTDMRNIDLEEISRSLTHPCRFLEKGCTELHSCYEIRFHEVKCDYFQYKCPQCSHLGKFNEVVNHVKLLHPSLRIAEGMENPFPKNSEFLVANKFGMFYCTAFIYDSSIEWSVAFIGREKVSFSATISVKSKKGAKLYHLRKNGNTCKSIIHLNELKNSKVKDKNAVLYIRCNS